MLGSYYCILFYCECVFHLGHFIWPYWAQLLCQW